MGDKACYPCQGSHRMDISSSQTQERSPLRKPETEVMQGEERHDFIRKIKKANIKTEVMSWSSTDALMDKAAFGCTSLFPLPPPCRVQLKAAPHA